MSALIAASSMPPAVGAPAHRGSLLRSEVHRFRSRRLIQLLFVLALLGFTAGVGLAATQYAKPSAAGLADAQRRLDRLVAEQQAYRERCLRSPVPSGVPGGVPAEEFCDPPPTAENFGSVENFIDKQPFRLTDDGLGGAVRVAVATAGLAFLIGATYIGADWSSRALVALLFWQPRRLRVMTAKLAVLTAAAALLGLLAQAAWLLAAPVLAATRGVSDVPSGFWPDLTATAGRGVLLTVLAALLGFALANLIRNTAAALGGGFLYFAVVENAVRVANDTWQPWLLTNNALALVQHGGSRIHLEEGFLNAQGVYEFTGRELPLTNLHGGLVLTLATLTALALGVALFTRRDLN